MNDLSKYLIVFGISFFLSFLLTRVMIRLGPRFGMIDIPDQRRIHKTPIPRAGGVAVFIAFHVTAFIFYLFVWPSFFPSPLNFDWWLSFLVASSILFAVGVWDDIKGVRPIVKLSGQVLAAATLFFLSGKGFDSILGFKDIPMFINLLLTIIWCVALINAFNLIDGMDGLCSGLAIISSLGIAAAYILRSQPADSLIVLALIGAAFGFLRYNFHPAKIFLGDSGSMFLGFTLAAFALFGAGKSTVMVSVGIPFIAAGIPIMDTVLAIWRRSARRLSAKMEGDDDGPHIMGADKEHLHHRLLEAGFSQRKVAVILYIGNFAMVTVGLFSVFMSKALVGLFLIIFIAGVYVVVRHVIHVEIWDTGRLIAQGIRRPGRALLGMIVYPVWDLIWLSVALITAMLLEDPKLGSLMDVGSWARLLPVWISPVFLMLVLGNTYSRVWSRSNFRDYLILFFSLISGILLTLAFFSAAEADIRMANVRVSITFAFLGMIGIFGIRVILQTFREWMLIASFDDRLGSRYLVKHILLYGAGNRGALYLRELRLIHPDEMATRKIIGFLDDNTNLRQRFLHGVRVMGCLDELEHIISENDIDEIVITADLLSAHETRLKEIAARHEVAVSEWKTHLSEVDLSNLKSRAIDDIASSTKEHTEKTASED
ncbi:MAG: hypothetical protein AAFX93_03640 [Verrucomicrobiota bacterium]